MSGGLLNSSRKISALLLDITGVLYNSGEGGGHVIPGSPQAVARYKQTMVYPTVNRSTSRIIGLTFLPE